MKNNLFIISGPSGAGEDSIISGLGRAMPIERVITTTSRPMREGEVDGQPYYFTSREEFIKKRDAGGFFEWAEQYNGNLYGVTFEEIERVKKSDKIGIWKIEYKGVITAKKLIPDIVAIFISAPLEVLEKRIRNRDQNIDERILRERMEYSKKWLEHKTIYDYEVENKEGRLKDAVDRVISIIKENKK